MPFAEIADLREYKVRGMPVIELSPRSGDKIMLGSVLFRSTEAFEQFRRELRARVP